MQLILLKFSKINLGIDFNLQDLLNKNKYRMQHRFQTSSSDR